MIIFNKCQSLNNLTIAEKAIIGASLRYLYEDRFGCFNESKFRSEAEFRSHQLRNNCRRIISNSKAFYNFDNINYKTCVCNFFHPQIVTLINMQKQEEKIGVDYKKIKNKHYQAMNLIAQYKAEIEAEALRKQQQQMKNRK